MMNMRDAHCKDAEPEMFFVGDHESVTQAKALCAACPIRVECLTMALKQQLDGVWGGTTLAERRGRVVRQVVRQANIQSVGPRRLSKQQADAMREANQKKQLDAGIAAAAKALTVLMRVKDQLAPEVRETLELRANRPELSLEDLGRALSTPVTKHVVAGRLRRAQDLLRPKKKRESNG